MQVWCARLQQLGDLASYHVPRRTIPFPKKISGGVCVVVFWVLGENITLAFIFSFTLGLVYVYVLSGNYVLQKCSSITIK